MCGTPDRRKPEQKLADLMRRELDITIDPIALRLFLRGNWDRVAGLAHAIHDAGEPKAETKAVT